MGEVAGEDLAGSEDVVGVAHQQDALEALLLREEAGVLLGGGGAVLEHDGFVGNAQATGVVRGGLGLGGRVLAQPAGEGQPWGEALLEQGHGQLGAGLQGRGGHASGVHPAAGHDDGVPASLAGPVLAGLVEGGGGEEPGTQASGQQQDGGAAQAVGSGQGVSRRGGVGRRDRNTP